MAHHLRTRFARQGKKRILALDGGGIRGIFTLGILEKLEELINQNNSSERIVLGDYYDIISGTSTGALIGTCLAKGMKVQDIITLYEKLGTSIFNKSLTNKWWLGRDNFIRGLFKQNYDSDKIEEFLFDEIKELTLGSEELRCGLIINAKRADTNSLWSVTNHPDGKYYEANKDLKLWELCRATSAAPFYFKPKFLNTKRRNGEIVPMAFIDGGVSLANNPAWISFLISQEPTFGYKFKSGEENLHITSLGTGLGEFKDDPNEVVSRRAIGWASKLADLFQTDALELNQICMSAFGKNIGPHQYVDGQFVNPDLLSFYGPDVPKLFTFERHNIKLNKKTVDSLTPGLSDAKILDLKEMDHAENLKELRALGIAYAKENIMELL